ncbi:MAG: hypothetical protein R3A45_03850 [Bdellovibrionota bacterium]
MYTEFGDALAFDERGQLLLSNFNNHLDNSYLDGSTAFIILIGMLHTGEAEFWLSKTFNTFYYMESAFLSTDSDYLTSADYLIASLVRNKVFDAKPYKKAKPIAIIFGDDHLFEYDFKNDFPSGEDLQSLGIDQIVFAGEHLMYSNKKMYDLADLENHPLGSYRDFAQYIDGVIDSTLCVEVGGWVIQKKCYMPQK